VFYCCIAAILLVCINFLAAVKPSLKEGKLMEFNAIMVCNTLASGGFVPSSLQATREVERYSLLAG
jgi:hypothetical protein